MRTFILALMSVAALTLLAASAVHANLLGPIDPFPGAAPPEAVLGIVLAITAVAAFLSWGARGYSQWPRRCSRSSALSTDLR
ncbi:MAG: hypothetical protein E6J38_04160 [Chloroflexi bacterium]|nr:MAG: hypothetical protein E6J38_04160 [Chloroflexota bacterium]